MVPIGTGLSSLQNEKGMQALCQDGTCLGKRRQEEQCYGAEGCLECQELRPDSSSEVWEQCLTTCPQSPEHTYLYLCWCHHSPALGAQDSDTPQPSSLVVPGQIWGIPMTPPPQHIIDHCHFITVIKLLFPLSQSSWVLFCSVIKLFHLLGLLLNSSQDKAAGHASRDTGTDAHTGFIFTNKALCWSCCFSAWSLATPWAGVTPVAQGTQPRAGGHRSRERREGRLCCMGRADVCNGDSKTAAPQTVH